jgi:hypothetical protein
LAKLEDHVYTLEQSITLEELRQVSAEELLRAVWNDRVALKVSLADGQTVRLEPEPELKPLPLLEGSMPSGWKDAIYG